jgi:hypothetical protein
MENSFESILKKSEAALFFDKDDLLKGGNGTVLVDFKNDDYRGFCFCIHPTFGLMMLHCTRKKNKGPHYQLAGGHVDEPEFAAAGKSRYYKQEKHALMDARTDTSLLLPLLYYVHLSPAKWKRPWADLSSS